MRQHPRVNWWFQKVEIENLDLPSVTMVITSGSLLRIEAWDDCGRFDEALFIDYVDTDFCLKCLARGWQIAVSAGGRMTHQLGSRERRRIVVTEADATFSVTGRMPIDTVEFADELTLVELSR